MIAAGGASLGLSFDAEALAWRFGYQSGTNGSSVPKDQDQANRFGSVLTNLADQESVTTSDGSKLNLLANGDSRIANESLGGNEHSTGWNAFLANLTDQNLAASTAGTSGAADTASGAQEQSTGLSTLLANLTDQKFAAPTAANLPTAGTSGAGDTAPGAQEQSAGLSTLLANLTDQKPAAPTTGTSGAADAAPGAQGQSAGLSALIGPLGQVLAPLSPTPTAADPKSGQFQTNSKMLPSNNHNAAEKQQKIASNLSINSGLDLSTLQSNATLGPSAPMVTAPIPSSNTNQSGTTSPLSANAQLNAAQASLNQTLPSGAAPQKTEAVLSSGRSNTALRQQSKLASPTSGPDNTSNATLNPGMYISASPVAMVVNTPPVARSAISVPSNIDPNDKIATAGAQPSTGTTSSLNLENSKLPDVIVVSQETHLAMTPTLPPMQQIIDVIRTISNPNEPSSIEGSTTSLPITTPSIANKTTQMLTIQLEPENLGTVIVKMRLSANSLELNIDASNPHTANILLKEKSILSDSLQTSNYKVDLINIGNSDVGKSDLQGRSNDPQQQGNNATLDMGLSSSNSGAGSAGQGQGQGQNNSTSDSRRITDIGPEIFEGRAGSDGANYTRGLFV